MQDNPVIMMKTRSHARLVLHCLLAFTSGSLLFCGPAAAQDQLTAQSEQASYATPLRQTLSIRSQSPQVRELQVRLRHAKALATYDVDDIFGPQTRQAVINFQRANDLKATGIVDQATWDVLLTKSENPTAAELNNTDIGSWLVSPEQPVFIMELQHRLRQVKLYAGSIDGQFNEATAQAVRHWRRQIGLPESEVMDERTWQRLIARSFNPSYASLFASPPEPGSHAQELDPRCKQGKVVCLSKEQKLISYVINGQAQITRKARFSTPEFESPEGDFKIWYKNRDTISKIFGERIPMPYAFFYDGNVAVHFSQDFVDVGYDGGSHGCSQLNDYQAAKWLYEQVKVGDRVVVY